MVCCCLDIKIFLGDDEEEEDGDDDQIEELVTEENQTESMAMHHQIRSSSTTGKYADLNSNARQAPGSLMGAGALSSAASQNF